MKPKKYWGIRLTTGLKSDFSKLSESDQWRVRNFVRSVVHIKDPVKFYKTTKCPNCPPSVRLFGISDDGLGNKGIEVQVWLRNPRNELIFLKCRKAEKP